MKLIFKNCIKGLIFYTTLCLCAWSIGFFLEDLPLDFKVYWFAFVVPFVIITYFMCKGKTVKEFKEFTGIDWDY